MLGFVSCLFYCRFLIDFIIKGVFKTHLQPKNSIEASTMAQPIVLVMSECKNTDIQSIINDLRKLPENDGQVELSGGKTGYKHAISTKYYKTEIVFYPVMESLATLPEEIKSSVEGLILYFDATDRTFLGKLETYANFLEDHDVEFGLLICDHIFDEKHDGITYREAKEHSKVLDLIELNPETEEPGGYDEVHRAMNNTIWSNIEMNEKREEDKKENMSEQEMEEKLADFENLLTQAMTFRTNTADMGRNERLLYAQQFADAFESIFGPESDDEAQIA